MDKIILQLACGVFLLLALPWTVGAVDFTFNVPVDVNTQPVDVNEGQVKCIAKPAPTANTGDVGEGVQFFSLENGNFQGTVTVAFNASPGQDRSQAREWQCIMQLKNDGGQFAGGGDDTNGRLP